MAAKFVTGRPNYAKTKNAIKEESRTKDSNAVSGDRDGFTNSGRVWSPLQEEAGPGTVAATDQICYSLLCVGDVIARRDEGTTHPDGISHGNLIRSIAGTRFGETTRDTERTDRER